MLTVCLRVQSVTDHLQSVWRDATQDLDISPVALAIVGSFARGEGGPTSDIDVVVLHDLNLACRYADHIVAMKSGKIVTEGRPVDVMTETVVREVFGMTSRIVVDPISETPMIVPIGRHHVDAVAKVPA